MWCSRVRNQISAYVDGELSGAEARTVAEHIKHCPSCAQERDCLAGLARMASLIPEEDLPSGLHARIMSRLAYADAPLPAAHGERSRRVPPFGPLIWTAAVAGATATVAFAYVQNRASVDGTVPDRAAAIVSPPASPGGAALRGSEGHPLAAGGTVEHGKLTLPEPTSVAIDPGQPVPALAAAPVGTKSGQKLVRGDGAGALALPRETRPQPVAVSNPSGKPTIEMRAMEPVTPAAGSENPEMLPGSGEQMLAVGSQPGTVEPAVAIEKEPAMRMAGMAPIEEQIEGEEDEGIRSLRMFFDERNRTVPQPPALPKRKSKPL